ncbi:MAG: MerR family transcriptional regulator [Nocardia sp.]|nr:MerR family transcriptional regulator [Nocardia sp.]
MSSPGEFTIDELARMSGSTVRSLRVYHERGVLPPPVVKGRTGFYGPEHLNRVHTITRLLERGIKLNGIKELLNAWDRGDDLGDVLGVEAAADIAADGAIEAAELVRRFRDVPNGLTRVVAIGLFEPVDANTYKVADPVLVQAMERLEAVGISMSGIVDELESLVADCERVARRFADLFRHTVWSAFRDSDQGAADVARLAAGVDAVRDIPAGAAGDLLGRFIRRYLDQDRALTEALSES